MKAFRVVLLFVSLALMTGARSRVRAAASIQFPEEELASESVLPVFDHKVAVKNKNILTAKRWEVGPVASLSLLEPFYNPMSFGLSLTYHFKDVHAFNVYGAYYMEGLNNNGAGLNPIPNTTTNMNLQYAPTPKYALLGEYQYTAFYGKMSLGKDYVMNLMLYGIGGVGAMGVGDSFCPAVDLGLGQKFFFTRNFAVRTDFRFITYYGPDILSKRLDGATSAQPAANFDKKLNYSSVMSLALVFFMPGM